MAAHRKTISPLQAIAQLADALVDHKIVMERVHALTTQVVAVQADLNRLNMIVRTIDTEALRHSLDKRLDDHNAQIAKLSVHVGEMVKADADSRAKWSRAVSAGVGQVDLANTFKDIFSKKPKRKATKKRRSKR